MAKEWKPVKQNVHDFTQDDRIEGKLVSKVESDYGGYDYILETKDGTTKVFGKTVLNNKMTNIEPGTMIRITYLGQKKSEKSGMTYHDYEVEIQA